MSFTQESIEHIAHLARLGTDNLDEIKAIQSDLNRIVGMVDQISSANTEGIEPAAHSMEIAQRLRPDVVTESDEREKLLNLANQPFADIGLFLVPQVIE